MGLVNRLVPRGQALEAAVQLAREIARFPQPCLRSERPSACEQWLVASVRGGAGTRGRAAIRAWFDNVKVNR